MLLNIIAFQIGWFACLLGAAHNALWLSLSVTIAVIGLHLYRARQPQKEWILILLSGLLGMVVDSLLAGLGFLHFSFSTVNFLLAPSWMLMLWMMFATLLNVSLRWLKSHLGLASLLGLTVAPLTYYGGVSLGGAQFGDLIPSLIAVAVLWMIAMPLLLVIAARWDGMAETSPVLVAPDKSVTAKKPM